LAEQLGVDLHTNCGVKRILMNDAGTLVRGIQTDDGEIVELAAIVSNADSVRTHRELLNATAPRGARRFAKRRTYEPACSGVVLYLGLKKRYEHLLHHDFVFSRDPEEEFDSIYKKGEPAPDPANHCRSMMRCRCCWPHCDRPARQSSAPPPAPARPPACRRPLSRAISPATAQL